MVFYAVVGLGEDVLAFEALGKDGFWFISDAGLVQGGHGFGAVVNVCSGEMFFHDGGKGQGQAAKPSYDGIGFFQAVETI